MGKTSVARELGRRLEARGWIFLFADVEGASCPEDVIADIAQAVHPARPILSRFVDAMRRWVGNNVEEVSAYEFRLKVRAGLNAGNWRHHGQQLIRDCAMHDRPALLVIDELPIFLKRMLDGNDGKRQVDEFLSWLRRVFQTLEDESLTLIVSGSIGLTPLVKRLGIPDRINYLDPFRLGPWSREDAIVCFERLATSCGLTVEAGVASTVYGQLGIGISHHVQSFFARLQDFAVMQGRKRVTVEDVDEVYRTVFLGPSGQNDLVHYETRLKEGLEEENCRIAMEILAEAATQQAFAADARRCLERLYSKVVDEAPGRIADVLEVLEHDGYLQAGAGGYSFPSRLLKDYFSARFRGHHTPLASRCSDDDKRRSP